MSGELSLLLAIGIIVAFWLLTSGSGEGDRAPDDHLADRTRHTAAAIERIEEEYRQWLSQTTDRDLDA
jgi:hypothetical protein